MYTKIIFDFVFYDQFHFGPSINNLIQSISNMSGDKKGAFSAKILNTFSVQYFHASEIRTPDALMPARWATKELQHQVIQTVHNSHQMD